MTKKDKVRFAELMLKCSRALGCKTQQSIAVWRGDMHAIIAAYKQLQRNDILKNQTRRDPQEPT